MFKHLLITILLLAGTRCFAQTDTIFIHGRPDPDTGIISVQYKNQKVAVKKNQATQLIPFNEIDEIRTASGKVYLKKNIHDQSALLVALVQGEYSLLYLERGKVFYVEHRDTTKVISNQHIKLALPVIFGQQTVDEYVLQANENPRYTFSFLKGLTSFANQKSGSRQVVNTQTFNSFKPKLYVGPSVLVSSNQMRLVKVAKNVNTGGYDESATYKMSSVPVGITIRTETSPRLTFELNAYKSKFTITDLSGDQGGLSSMLNVQFYSIPDSYQQNLKLHEFGYATTSVDLSARFYLIKKDRAKIRPFISVGPALSVMSNQYMKLVSRQNGSDEILREFRYTWNKPGTKVYMFALQGSAGLDYRITDRIQANIFFKYVRGRFPRVLHRGEPLSETPATDEAPNENIYDHSYDQYMNILSGGAALVFRVF